MCGIFCLICKNVEKDTNFEIDPKLDRLLKNRGPDASNGLKVTDNVWFSGFVLWQQGEIPSPQPVEENNVVLLFNGDIFNLSCHDSSQSDTSWLAKALSQCSSDDEIIALFKNLKGPFSLVFYNKNTEHLYFLRDSLGRNSLLLETSDSDIKILSTSYNYEKTESRTVIELPPIGLYKLSTRNTNEIQLFPWKNPIDNVWEDAISRLERHFALRISSERSLNPLWLKNEKPLLSTFNFYELCQSCNELKSTESLFEYLLANDVIKEEIKGFGLLLEKSLKDRVDKTPAYCKNCILKEAACAHSKVAILFSGGIDCSILAVVADKYVPRDDPIDLINVAFENTNGSNIEDAPPPDRISAMESLGEIKKLCPTRKWNLVKVNVSRQELHDALNRHIKHLVFPLQSILDESLGAAFWFASHGVGVCENSAYTSGARITLLGSGADELFGGYIRHRNAFRRCNESFDAKLKSVEEELEKDFQALPTRNFARDDRVIGDTGRTKRTPFIEEDLIQYVRSLRASQRCCYILEEGIGDKLFLRLYGFALGLRRTALFKKRAIQFGTRIANKKQNAKDLSEFLRH